MQILILIAHFYDYVKREHNHVLWLIVKATGALQKASGRNILSSVYQETLSGRKW